MATHRQLRRPRPYDAATADREPAGRGSDFTQALPQPSAVPAFNAGREGPPTWHSTASRKPLVAIHTCRPIPLAHSSRALTDRMEAEESGAQTIEHAGERSLRGGKCVMSNRFRTWGRRMPRWLAVALCATPLQGGCAPSADDEETPSGSDAQGAFVDAQEAARRERMVVEQLQRRDIVLPRVLAVMRRVPRHKFVPRVVASAAYDDRPLPIGHGQTISQPYIVALMTQLVDPAPTSRVLDVGTGSGYQAAVLAELAAEVYSMEIVAPLAEEATQRLQALGYANVHVRQGDGYRGWPEHAPFDAIVVAAAPAHVPQPLIDQLAPGGRMAIPVGQGWQELLLIEKDEAGRIYERSIVPVAFVPMTGEAER